VSATPWLSVIIPTYNGSAYLRQALDSIAVQDDPAVEVIAVDDGSTDDTVGILRSYSERLNLEIIEQGRVANWVAGTNRGLSAASAPVASILHQDDLWFPGRLARVRAALGGADGDVLLAHPVLFVDRTGRRVGRWRCPLPRGRALPPDVVLERLLVQNFFSLPGTVFPREVALEGGGLDERLWYTADWDLWLRLASRLRTLYIEPTLGAVRVHASSITTTETGRIDEFRWQHEEVLRRHLASWNVNGRRLQRVRAAAELSIDVNSTLAAKANGMPASLGSLLGRALKIGPGGWGRYVRNSRIHERVGSRLRAGLGRRSKG
jgi:glycosyltransferase involved in cell wall biosynthesis